MNHQWKGQRQVSKTKIPLVTRNVQEYHNTLIVNLFIFETLWGFPKACFLDRASWETLTYLADYVSL